ncbi:hypothetical protein BDV19DRAFT_352151 [Aspergillus venezuelensis]
MDSEKKLAALEAKIAALEKKLDESIKESAPNLLSVDSTEETADVSVTCDDEKKNKKTQSRARIVINKPNADGVREDVAPNQRVEKKSSDTEKNYAFTLRKIISDENSYGDSEIEIESPDLWELLKKVIVSYPYHTFQGSLPKSLYSPYEAIVFYWGNLVKATQDPDAGPEEARSDLRELLDVIESGSGDTMLDSYFRKRASFKEQKLITYEALWTLFPPGSLIYGKTMRGQGQVFIVEDNTYPWPRSNSSRLNFRLKCWAYDWDGSQFKRLPLVLTFDQFDVEKPVDSLPYYPLEFHEDPEALKTRLVARGMKYRQLCTAKPGSQMFDYQGYTVFLKKGFSGASEEDPDNELISQDIYGSSSNPYHGGHVMKSIEVRGRVMVDFQSYFRYGLGVASIGDLEPDEGHSECACPHCLANEPLKAVFRSHFDEASIDGHNWHPEQYMLCPPRVLGYILREKQWAQLEVDSLSNVPSEGSDSAWSSGLKLESDLTKNMILDLVTGHGKQGLEVHDIVERKGKGLVILLYGPPGVGKTSTAETVAIKAQKPLFAISVADVGITAKNVEANLARIFALATTWQAILLIDEADVFLQSRSLAVAAGNNTERNALVSVFLRVLEYYQGILVLTTNQIAQFDIAVHSRIHVAIKYKEMDAYRALEIFKNFLIPLNKENRVRHMDEILEWLQSDAHRMNFDGRQIRNVVTSACSLARAEGSPQLQKSHLMKVVDNIKDYKLEFVRQFEQYKSQQRGYS